MANKKEFAAGLQGLLMTEATPETTATAAKEYKTVCYNLAPELIEDIRRIAFYDRKRINAVVSEALAQYINSWNAGKPTTEEPQRV